MNRCLSFIGAVLIGLSFNNIYGQSDTHEKKYQYEICTYIEPKEKPCLLINIIEGIADTNLAFISGRIYDYENNPFPFSNIGFKSNKDSFFKGTYTDSLGNFKIYLPIGNYKLDVTYTGLKTFVLDKLQLDSGQLRYIEVKL